MIFKLSFIFLICALAILIKEIWTIKWNEDNDEQWAIGCDFEGNDLSNDKSKSEDCSEICSQTSGCTHYTWTNYNDGTCWMKSGGASKSQAVENDDRSVCGIVKFLKFDELSDPIKISYEQFKASLTINNFEPGSFEKYQNFIFQVTSKGGITTLTEAAMFLAQIYHESGGLKFKKELACLETECPDSYPNTIGVPGRHYYGRGYMQLTWDFNYKAASFDLYGDDRLLQNPDMVSDSEEVAWLTAFWYWKTNVGSNPRVKNGDFGASTKLINGFLECNGENKEKAITRFKIYKNIFIAFDIHQIPNEKGCYN